MNLSFKVKKSSGCIFDYLTDAQKFVAVHPVISKMEKKNVHSYLVHETLKIGFVPFSFTYPVTIIPYPLQNKVIILATVMKSTTIEITFILKASEDFTVVEETILFKSSLPVKSIMQRVFKKQHCQLFKNIEMMK